MNEERRKLFDEIWEIVNRRTFCADAPGKPGEPGILAPSPMEARLGTMKAKEEPPYGPAVLEHLDRLRIDLQSADEAIERLYDKTKMVTFPEPANQVIGCGAEIEQVLPPVAEDLRESCRRLERLTSRINYLVGRIGL